MFVRVTEAEIGALDLSINPPTVDEEDRRVQEDQRTANSSDSTLSTPQAQRNDTVSEVTLPGEPARVFIHELSNISRVDTETIVDPQRDQGDPFPPPMALNDDRERDLSTSERLTEHSSRTKAQETSRDYHASTRSSPPEAASSSVPWIGQSPHTKGRDELDDIQVDDEGLSNVVEHGDAEAEGFEAQKYHGGSPGFTAASVKEIATEPWPVEQKNVEDIRAISFQVPSPVEESAERLETRQRGNEEARKLGEPRKDHSRPMNNLLLGGSKSTKAFYEIKPSIKTEMENERDQQPPSTTQRTLGGRKFVLPSVDSAFGKFGPYFEDGDQEVNFTARIGSTMLLDCKIGMLGDKEVRGLLKIN